MFKAVIVMKHQEHIVVWLQTHDMAGFKICIYTTATDRKWLPVGLCRSSSSYERAAVLHFKWSLSDLRARQPTNRRPDLTTHYF